MNIAKVKNILGQYKIGKHVYVLCIYTYIKKKNYSRWIIIQYNLELYIFINIYKYFLFYRETQLYKNATRKGKLYEQMYQTLITKLGSYVYIRN